MSRQHPPTQRKLPFSSLLENIPDESHEMTFAMLHAEITSLIKNGIGKRAASTNKSLWTLKHSTEFLSHATLVARPAADGSWEMLLRSRSYRSALLTGVVMMLLEKHVFSDLLFGAGEEQAEVLRMEDSSMVNVEGFRRTALRADTNRVYLEATGGIPPLFWKRVDSITARITALLAPLSAAVGGEIASPPSYQALHDIVALAGWLNIAMRLCPKITTFEWVQPGEAYRHSFLSIGEDKQTSRGSPESHRIRSRVMISTTPKITRHVRSSKGFFGGTETYEVMKPHVFTYTGHLNDREDSVGGPLHSHVRSRLFSSPIRLLALLVNAVRLLALACLVGVLGLMMFGAWSCVPATYREMILLPIRLSFRGLKWWLGVILQQSEVNTRYNVVNTGWSWTG
ncbi:hypothetical protein M440DRAFT_1400921 [Trichoderma longibrachiatum ATCC 18648]|uniref:Uncharacterized protein n=1 Tax=Trichoderma longibrachiatum ATCC 18648 TaxID=983965 RepID=A0A2T4C8S8_TRILO|nr:hypothetical protein M440DRAFT_1400921 [Trichoderma longibrachiatum ATCC 18648]